LVYLKLDVKILTVSLCLLDLIIGLVCIGVNLMRLYYLRYFIGLM